MNAIDTQNKELIVRKRMSAFLEKALRYCGYDFRHDDYKQIIYGESGCKTDFEIMMKNMYDAYHYLLFNAQSPLSAEVLKRFFYILDGQEGDETFFIRMTSKFFYMNDMPPFERAVEFHLYVYSELCGENEDCKLIVPLMFFNFALVKAGIPTLRFVNSTLQKYEECRTEYFNGNKAPIYKLFLEQIQEAKFQDKGFYEKLKPLTAKEICERIFQNKDTLQNRYGIESVALFGSFSKGLQRIDSDIDVLIVYSSTLSYEEKARINGELASLCMTTFNRYLDITEISEYVNDWIVKEIINYKKIF